MKSHSIRMKLLEDLMDHMDQGQGSSLRNLMEKGEKKESPLEESLESPEYQDLEDTMNVEKHPQGVSISKVEVIKKPKKQGADQEIENMLQKQGGMEVEKNEDEMSDEELEELLNKLKTLG